MQFVSNVELTLGLISLEIKNRGTQKITKIVDNLSLQGPEPLMSARSSIRLFVAEVFTVIGSVYLLYTERNVGDAEVLNTMKAEVTIETNQTLH